MAGKSIKTVAHVWNPRYVHLIPLLFHWLANHIPIINSPYLSQTKEELCIEAQERGKHFALIIKSSLFQGIFIDAKGVNCASLEIVGAKKIFHITISGDLLENKHQPVSELGITFVNKMLHMRSKLIQIIL